MKPIWELKARECRGPVGDSPNPGDGFWETLQMFCAAATAEKESYCPACKAKYHNGSGKNWQGLAEMMRLSEQTISKVRPSYGTAYETDANTPLEISIKRESQLTPSEKRVEATE